MQNRRDGEGKNPIIGPTLISEVIGLKKNSFLTTIFFAYVGPHTSAKLEQFSQWKHISVKKNLIWIFKKYFF